MLTQEGRAKILDLAWRATPPSPPLPHPAPTKPRPPTHNHTAPEPSSARCLHESRAGPRPEAGYRSDQFSFGVILYEMASGKQAFAKPSNVETMAAIVPTSRPPLKRRSRPRSNGSLTVASLKNSTAVTNQPVTFIVTWRIFATISRRPTPQVGSWPQSHSKCEHSDGRP